MWSSDKELYNACLNNNKDLALKLMNTKKDYDCLRRELLGAQQSLILSGACIGGNKEIVEKIIEKGCKNFNWGLQSACRGGHKEIVLLMIQKGANCFDIGLREACFNGHIEIVKLMIEKGADNLDAGLNMTCLGGKENKYKEIILLLLEKGAKIDNYKDITQEDLKYLKQKGVLLGKYGKFI